MRDVEYDSTYRVDFIMDIDAITVKIVTDLARLEDIIGQLYDDITLISPTDFYQIGKNYHKSESEVMRFDLRMVREADIVLGNLRDLHTSLGTSDEILYAFISGKPIIGFLEDESEIKNIHPWKVEQLDRIETGEDAMKHAIDYIYRYYVDRYN